MIASCEKFVFSKKYGDKHVEVSTKFNVPKSNTYEFFVHETLKGISIPPYALKDVQEALIETYEEALIKFHDDVYDQHFNELDIEAIVNDVSKYYDKNFGALDKKIEPSEDDKFSVAYNSLINSSAGYDLVKCEEVFNDVLRNEVSKKDDYLNTITNKHLDETKSLISQNNSETDANVTLMQQEFIVHRESIESFKNLEIKELKSDQWMQFRDFVMSFSDSNTTNSSINTFQNIEEESDRFGEAPRWSESFTVQLGRQLRIPCNLRLILSNLPSEFVSSKAAYSNPVCSLAERMSNSLQLYSKNLTGLVVLTEGIPECSRSYLAKFCNSSNEFHFMNFDEQLGHVKSSLSGLSGRNSAELKNARLGDVFITKHSNLVGLSHATGAETGGIHVVFHIVVESISFSGDDNSTNELPAVPLYLVSALHAVCRLCFEFSIGTLCLPLFLTHHRMHMPNKGWKIKRVECVLKTLKGILMELNTWRHGGLKMLQFHIPTTETEDCLKSYCAVLSRSFQLTTPFKVQDRL